LKKYKMTRYKYFFAIVFLYALNSCTYTINIHQNGTVDVTITDKSVSGSAELKAEEANFKDYLKLYDTLQNFEMISHYKRTFKNNISEINYRVKSLDSLKNYLFPFSLNDSDTDFDFKLYQDSFVFTEYFKNLDIHSTEFGAYAELADNLAILKFDKPILKFESDFKFIKQVSNKALELEVSKEEFNYSQGFKCKKLVVFFKR